MPDPKKTYYLPIILVIDAAPSPELVAKQELAKQAPIPQPADVMFINQALESIKIEQIRGLAADLSYAADSQRPRYVVILAADLLTIPAQNAFLKLLEEPPAQTQIWLITAYPTNLLATIRSRCTETRILGQDQTDSYVESAAAIDLDAVAALSHRELIELADTLKDQAAAQAYLLNMLYSAHAQLENSPADKRYHQLVPHILTAQQQLTANANLKLTLEHCFFTCKQILSSLIVR